MIFSLFQVYLFIIDPGKVSFAGAGSISEHIFQGAVMAGFDDTTYERDYPRETIRTRTEIQIDGQWQDCVIVNISPSGAKLNVGRQFGRGMGVLVKIGEFGQFNATVAWSHGDEIGVKFNHDPSEMANVLIGMSS